MNEQEQDKDETTDADIETGRQEDWEGEERTEVDAHPPADRPPELAKPRPRPGA